MKYLILSALLVIGLSGCASSPPPCDAEDVNCRIERLERKQQEMEWEMEWRETCRFVHGPNSILCL